MSKRWNVVAYPSYHHPNLWDQVDHLASTRLGATAQYDAGTMDNCGFQWVVSGNSTRELQALVVVVEFPSYTRRLHTDVEDSQRRYGWPYGYIYRDHRPGIVYHRYRALHVAGGVSSTFCVVNVLPR